MNGIPVDAFRPVLLELIADAGNQERLGHLIGTSGKMSEAAAKRRIYDILHDGTRTVSFGVADAIITGAGRPDLWHLGLQDSIVDEDEVTAQRRQRDNDARRQRHKRQIEAAAGA